MPPGYEIRVRVRYAETDQMGVAYHANYLVWMDMARLEYCRSVGVEYREMEDRDGVVLAVVEASCRYLHPARFDDEIRIGVTATKSTPRTLRFAYEMRQTRDERQVATGETAHLYLSRTDFRPTRLPRKYHAAFGISPGAAA